jgi:hypothetical protein
MMPILPNLHRVSICQRSVGDVGAILAFSRVERASLVKSRGFRPGKAFGAVQNKPTEQSSRILRQSSIADPSFPCQTRPPSPSSATRPRDDLRCTACGRRGTLARLPYPVRQPLRGIPHNLRKRNRLAVDLPSFLPNGNVRASPMFTRPQPHLQDGPNAPNLRPVRSP